MDRIVVRPSGPLTGSVTVGGAKNAVLKLMAATLLAEGRHVLRNVPRIADVDSMAAVLRAMGASVEWAGEQELAITCPAELVPEAPYELVERFRASIVVLGPLLARCGRAKSALPGGDDFGPRPIDMHVRGLELLGAEFATAGGYIEARAEGGLYGTRVTLEFPSHTATDNLLMASVLAKGTTVIDNAAREPEIADLAAMLNRMGARVVGAGTATIEVEGVERLSPVEHTVIPDRIEAATYLAAVGVAGGEITVVGARPDHMDMLIQKFGQMGMRISPDAEGIWALGTERLRSVDVATLPYPGLATDYKPLFVAMLAVADGVGIVTENIFGTGRFRYVDELLRMGADIRTEARHAVVRGVERLQAAPVRAHDLRAGAAMVVAGLRTDGETVVHDAHHIERGYARFVDKLRALGADVDRA
jgi:UDP-N-acetylglucosamine 1-carboxyvinyltransferase